MNAKIFSFFALMLAFSFCQAQSIELLLKDCSKFIRQRDMHGLSNNLQKVDSLKNAGAIMQDSSLIDFTFYLGINAILHQEFDTAKHYILMARTIAEEKGTATDVANIVNSLGAMYHSQGKIDSALHYFNKSLESYTKAKDTLRMGSTHNYIGLIYKDQAKVTQSLHHLHKGLEYGQVSKDTLLIAVACNNLGVWFEKLDSVETAKRYYQEAATLHKYMGNTYRQTGVLMNIGILLNGAGNYQEAINQYLEGVSICKANQYPDLLANFYNNIGRAYSLLKKPELALLYFDSCLALEKSEANIVMTQVNKADNLLELGKIKEAKALSRNALNPLKEKELKKVLYNAYSILDTIYQLTGNIDSAYYFASLKHQLHKTFSSDDALVKIENLRNQHELVLGKLELNKKEKEIALQQELIAVQSKQLDIAIFSSGVIFLFALLLLFFGLNNWKSRKTISAQKLEIEALNTELKNMLYAAQSSLNLNEEKIAHFSHVNSHELRAPVANILGLVLLIKHHSVHVKDQELRQLSDLLEQSTQSLDETIKRIQETLHQ